MALTTTLHVRLNATQKASLDLSINRAATLAREFSFQLDDGTGAGQADVMFADERTIAASDDEDLDFAGGDLEDVLGAAFEPATIKLIYIEADSANTNNVVVTQPVDTGFPWAQAAGGGVAVKPGGVFLLFGPGAAGIGSVTADTGDLINIANSGSGSSVTYRIVIIGVASSV